MLIEFKVSNYRSIGEEQVISLLPNTSQDEYKENILESGSYKALNVNAIYGSNGSGKSNVLAAMAMLDKMVYLSARTSSTTSLPYDPFLLKEGYEEKPTKFEITFVIDDTRYRYGIEFFQKKISREWLYKKRKSRELLLFGREEDTIETTSSLKGNKTILDAAIEATRSNGLFLSTCDMLNLDEAKTIMKWFGKFHNLNGIDTEMQEVRIVEMWNDPEMQSAINNYITKLNLGIIGLEISKKKFDENDLPEGIEEKQKRDLINRLKDKEGYVVAATHQLYDSSGNKTTSTLSWKLDDRESEGTIKSFHLSGPIIAALKTGGILVIDEIEAKMHPIITLNIINLFLNKTSNPNNAQLIFATHDTNLLTYSKLRRDQILFTEKNKWESTEIYSLSDIKYPENNQKERLDTNKEKR